MVNIKLEGVTKRFGKVVAVRDVTFEISDGKLYVLLGPSGGGKTTLLYLIAGIYKPTRGRIFFDDKDVTDLPPSLRNVGLVFQNYALYPHMSVYDNIAFPLKLRKLPEDVIEKKVHDAVKLLRIEELLRRYPSQLSGGQQQRVALARALVKEPNVLLLDEPLSNLDALLRIYIRTELKKLQKDLGITTVYVTHDQSEAMAIADSIVIINNGVIQQIGTPKEVYENPRNIFVATFIGSPPANIVRGRVIDGKPCVKVANSELCVENELGYKLSKLGTKEVIVAFRPEHTVISDKPLDSTLTLEGEVYAIEPLGKETIITVMVNDIILKCVAMGKEELPSGEKVYINIERRNIKLFDPSTELNLEYLN
jgi:inositol-phosphate transport system ATP-binding protein